MYHVLKKYKRRLLAVFTAALMIAFLVPTVGRMGRTPESIVRGRIGDEKIYLSEYQSASNEFELLSRYVFLKQQGGRGFPVIYVLGEAAVSQMVEHPDLYLLLQKEARRMGAFVPAQRVQDIYEQCEVRTLKGADLGVEQQVKRALGNVLMIEGAFRDAASTIKVSAPYREYALATRAQEMRVTAVEFDAASQRSKVPAPTEAQLKELYERYADIEPEAAARDPQGNLFELAYKFPHRVKLQYLYVPAAEVRKSVEGDRSADRWEVDARMHYLQNPAIYSSTTRPVGASATAPTTRVVKSFPEARKEVMESLIAPEIERRQTEIQRFINAAVTEDYNLYKAAHGATRPSSLKVAYGEYAYLQALAAELQKHFRVTARVESFSGWRSRQDLAGNELLAKVTTTGGVSLPAYATLTQPEYDKLQKRLPSLPRPLEVLQPSQSLTDDQKGLWYFRLTAIDPERKASGLAEVREQVERDWRLVESVKLARQAADGFLATARSKGFENAAQSVKALTLKSEFFARGGQIVGLHLEDALAPRFAEQAAKLLAAKAVGQDPAMGVVELPKQGRVFAVRLDEIRSELGSDYRDYVELVASHTLRSQLEQGLQARWFDYANVTQRLKYKEEGVDRPVPVQGPTNPVDWPQL